MTANHDSVHTPTTIPTSFGRHLRVALIFVAVALAHYLVADWGNQFGQDEWLQTFIVSRGGLATADRPLNLVLYTPVYWLVGFNGYGQFMALILLRAARAFVLYLLIHKLVPSEPLLAYISGIVHIAYFPFLWGYLDRLAMVSGLEASTFLTVLALLLFLTYLDRPAWWRLIPALAIAGLDLMVSEASVALLAVVPVIFLLVRWPLSRPKLIGTVLLWLVVLVAVGFYLRPFILPDAGPTYSSGSFQDLDPARLLSGIRLQYGSEFGRQILALETQHWLRYGWLAILQTAIALLGFQYVRPHTTTGAPALPSRLVYVLAIGFGLLAFFLAIAPYLPSGLINRISRVSFRSSIAVAIVFASGILLLGSLFRHRRMRALVQAAALCYVIAFGTANLGRLQQEMQFYGFEWEDTAIFLRSFAHLAPQLEDNTVVILMEDEAVGQNPFESGWGLFYALRYLYDDHAVGLIPQDTIFRHSWEISDRGVEISPLQPQANLIEIRHSFHRWDEVIFIAKQADGTVVILDQIPPEFDSPARSQLYAPYDRIVPGYIPARIEALFPPIQALPSP